jgi:Flp pilus assembly protein TadD
MSGVGIHTATRSTPLRRHSAVILALEKLPLLALALVSILLTFRAEKLHGAIGSSSDFPAPLRAANACVSYAKYLEQTFQPSDLAVFYPFPKTIPPTSILLAALLIIGVSLTAFARLRKQPELAVGWFWFLIALMPVIGIVQIGGHARADRYVYLPLIGVFIVIVWGTAAIAIRWRATRVAAGIVAGLMLIACGVQSRSQLRYWQSDETLFRRALAVTRENAVAHYNLGHFLERGGARDEAAAHYREAIRINPGYGFAHNNLANILARSGQWSEALQFYRAAIALSPQSAEAHSNMGAALARTGQWEDAIHHYRAALSIQPGLPGAHNNLGVALLQRGDTEAAISHFRQALERQPDYTAARVGLGNALAIQGELEEAIRCYHEALQTNPAHANAHYRLGLALRQKGDTNEADRHFREALRLDPALEAARQQLEAP